MSPLQDLAQLSGRSDPRLHRGLACAVLQAAVNAATHAVAFVFLSLALDGRLTVNLTWRCTAVLALLTLLELLLARPAFALVFTAVFSGMGEARLRVLDHLRRLPMGVLRARNAGEIVGKVTTDLALLEDIYAHALALFSATAVLPFFVGAWLCAVDWRLGLTVLVALPVSLLVLSLVWPLLDRRVPVVLEASSEASSRLVEYNDGIAVFRSFGAYGAAYERLLASLRRLRDAQLAAEVAPAPLICLFGMSAELSVVFVCLLGTHWLLGGSLAPSTFLLFLLVSASLSRRIVDFGIALVQLRTARHARARVQALLAEPPLPEPDVAQAQPTRFDIELDSLSFRYEGASVLKAVTARVPERALTALVGPSGSGKSTLVHLIARLWDLPPEQGTIRIGGVNVRDLPFDVLHSHVAMVFQDVTLFSGSVLDNIRVGRPSATLEQVIAAARAARAHDFVEALPRGYDTELGESGAQLSGGERQRLSIARAILKNAPIILLDEATASVDASAEHEIQGAIDALIESKTVLVVAHRLETVRRAQQILVLENGSISERGTHDELLSNGGCYARLWRRQMAPRFELRGPSPH